MKNIFNKIHISFFFLLIIFLSLISGLFRDVITLFLIVVIHEIGHVCSSLIFGWKISRIDLTVCGGYITYDEETDKPFMEEFLIAISGFIFQTIFYLIMIIINHHGFIDDSMLSLIRGYHYSILIFNLIPIYPLDGGKIISILINMLVSYKKSLKLINYLSVLEIFIICVLFLYLNLKIEYSYMMILSFIISKLIKNFSEAPHLFNRFLFERYVKPVNSKRYIYVKKGGLNMMRRQRKHYFWINKRYYNERELLTKKFD